MVLHRLGERTEDDAELGELLLERGRHRHTVEHRVHRDAGQQFLLVERNPELLEGPPDLGIDLIEALERRLFLRRGVINDVLVVDRPVRNVRPGRLLHREPHAIGLEAPLEQPLGLALLGRDQADDVFGQAARCRVLLDVGDEAVLVLSIREFLDGLR